MNTPVSFDLAKLLKEKGWQIPTLYYYFEDGVLIQNTIKDTVGMDYGSEFEVEFSEFTENWNDNFLTRKNGDRCFGCSKSQGYFETFSAPNISEVVMWLYEKNGLWVLVDWSQTKWCFSIIDVKEETVKKVSGEKWKERSSGVYLKTLLDFKSPTEAYEAAIKYSLNKLI